MVSAYRNFTKKTFSLFPLLILFFISLNGNSVINFTFFSVNIHYIVIYFFVLRHPENLGYGFIFLSGIIADIVFGLPLGVNALCALIISATATYVRNVTVRITLINDWISFIPALLIANLVYSIVLYFLDYPINYLSLFIDTISTFIFYPILWFIFSIMLNLLQD